MQLKNLECQLAMAQLKRYLGGSKLSEEALEALEAHLVECPQCQMAVQLQQQKPSDTPKTTLTHAVVESPAPTPASELSAEKPRFTMPKMAWRGNGKTLTLSVSLAAVLITMSALASDPTRLFGERMLKPGQKLPAGKITPPLSKPVLNTPAKAMEPTPKKTPETAAIEPAVIEPAPTPKVRPTARRTPARPARQTKPVARQVTPKPKPKPVSSGAIAVYDESGRLVR